MAKNSRVSGLEKIYNLVVRALSSDVFFYFVVALAVLQGLWFALSFQPTVMDEGRHLGNIFIYAAHWSPFLGKQPTSWDYLGQVVRDGSFMFYHIMAWFLRFFRLFVHGQSAQILCLRFVCITFFASGLVIYRKALLEIPRLSRSALHLAFLFFVITPEVALLPGAVNYDNLMFLLFALVLLLSVRIIKSNAVSFTELSYLLITGLFMAVVKSESLPLFIPVLLFIGYLLYKRYGRGFLHEVSRSAKRVSKPQLILIALGLVVALGLFIERPVVNVIRYHNPDPQCQLVIGAQRCEKFPDYVAYAADLASKPANFIPEDPVQYLFIIWEPRMADTAVNLLEQGHASELPIITHVYSFFVLAGAVVVLIYLRDFLKNQYFRFLIFVSVVYLFILTADEYQSYVTYAIPAAIRTRYLIPILPIFLYFVAVACVKLFGRFRKTALLSAMIILLLCTQGGSIVTYSLTTPPNLYWQNNPTKTTNNDLRTLLHPIVIEHLHSGQ